MMLRPSSFEYLPYPIISIPLQFVDFVDAIIKRRAGIVPLSGKEEAVGGCPGLIEDIAKGGVIIGVLDCARRIGQDTGRTESIWQVVANCDGGRRVNLQTNNISLMCD